MNLIERVKPKSKSGIVNYAILLVVLVQQILTFIPSIAFEAYNRAAKQMVSVYTSMQRYIWFPTTGNGKMNIKLTEQLEKALPKASSVINLAVLFPVLMMVSAIALLIVCLWFGGNKASTVIGTLWSIFGVCACFCWNVLFAMQNTYVVQMVLIFIALALSAVSIVLVVQEEKKKEKFIY